MYLNDNFYNENTEYNSLIELSDYDITYTAKAKGWLCVSAEYCEVDCPSSKKIILTDEYSEYPMNKGENIKIYNITNLKMIKFNNSVEANLKQSSRYEYL